MLVYLIVAVFVFFYVSFRGNIMITTLYAISLQADSFQVGLIAGLANLCPMLFAVTAGRVSDKVGFRYPLMMGSFGLGFSLLLPYLIKNNLHILYFSQVLFGLAFIFALVNIQNLIGGLSTIETRSKNFAIYGLGVSTASLIGPSITGFSIDHYGYSNTYLILSILAIIPGLFMALNLFKIPNLQSKKADTKNNVKDLLSSPSLRRTYITSATILTGIGLFEFYFPIYGEQIGFSASLIGIVLSVYASAFFIVRSLMPYLTKRFGEEQVLITCMFIAAIAFVLMPFFKGFITLTIVSFILGIGLGIGQPLSMSMAYNASPEGRTGEVLGLRITINKTAQFFVPIVFGSVGSMVGVFPVFISNALLFFSSALSNSIHKRNSVKDNEGYSISTD